jgi:tRNA (guanine-N7-)-methyltransferase
MGQKKLMRFEAIKSFPNVLQYPANMPGNWSSFFPSPQPITLELACGKGEYAVGLARLYPNRNFLGVDLKGNRLYVGAKTALKEELKNVGFLRTQIDKLDQYFLPGEVEQIWITFPDPQLRISKAKKRLTHPRFLRIYQQVLQPQGLIHLKTDSPVLFSFTKTVIEMYGLNLVAAIEDVHASNEISPELLIKTHYEGLDIAQSQKIYYIQFSIPSGPLPDLDEQLQDRIRKHEEAID